MNAILDFANSMSGRWAAWMIAASLDSAALLAFASLTWLAVRQRVAPQVGYCLFLLVTLKLLVPVSLPAPDRVARWTPSALVMAWSDSANKRQRAEPAMFARAAENDVSGSVSNRSVSNHSPSASATAIASAEATSSGEPGKMVATSPVAVHGVVDPSPRLSLTAALMIGWLFVVGCLFAWTIVSQLRFRAAVKRLSCIDAARLGVDLPELCRRAGVTATVRLVESDDLPAPAVSSVIRPTIILPRGVASALTASQLRWVLLHELAHVKRLDMLALTLERCAAVLYFFNPVVWIANRLADRLREYACDDIAAALAEDPVAEPADAFLQILRFANRPHGMSGAVGMFGLGTRAACFRRVRRLLDLERPRQPRLSRWTVSGLFIVALATLPYLRASSNGESEPSSIATASAKNDKDQSQRDDAGDEPIFDLLIVGPNGKPVPQAQVEIRTDPNLTAEQVLTGKFVKHGSYGTFLTADDAGRLRVKRPPAPGHFNVDITTPGFGPYWAGWSSDTHPEPVPAKFTAELEAGWSVGGVVVDGDGKPIEGVRVKPSIEFKKRPGDVRQLGVGTNLKTDAAGKWRFDSVPASKPEVFVEVDHPDFLPLRRSLTRSEFGIISGGQPSARIKLSAGLFVTGKITDESGNPIAGALVRTKFLNDKREATSGEDGTYRLIGCEPVMTRIVVWALGRALDMKEVRVEPNMRPINFQLQPGGHVRVRMLDEQGQPVPKARVFFQRWRGGQIKYFEFDHVNQYADLDGVWEWNEAPLDEFRADLCRPDGMQLAQQPLVARDQEYVFRLPPALVVSGNVVDAETQQPLAEFRVIPGIRSSESHMNWVRREQFTATDGKYSVRQTDDYFAHLVRIEADGYQPAVSRDIKSDEGSVTIDFSLKKGMNATATVLTPTGEPAAEAKVALGVAGSQIAVENGDIDESSTYCARQNTDAAGVFKFPPQDQEFQLVITHPSGFAHVKATANTLPETIALQAWARVEGTFRIGKEPAANVPVMIMSGIIDTYGDGVPHIYTRQEATTGKDGHFVFERVLPGRASVGRNLMLTVDDGALEATSACLVRANFPAGKTTHFDLGGNGRRVVGRLHPPPGFGGPVLWNF
ncbi:MAG TPA: M56 family metallopeptidase, partial [Pirellulales bacterium]|nr:M56 family metallopeptidase [Pirellulales bacterium]